MLQPKRPEGFFALGIIAQTQGDLRSAEQHYLSCVQTGHADVLAFGNLAMVYFEQWRFDDALALIDVAIGMDSTNADAIHYKGVILKQLGQHAASLAAHQQAVHLHPQHSYALLNIANHYAGEGALHTAVSYYQRALEADPQLTVAFYQLLATRNTMCDWQDRDANLAHMRQLILQQLSAHQTPQMQVVQSLGLPLSISELLRLAQANARQAVKYARGVHYEHSLQQHRLEQRSAVLRVGYISHGFGYNVVGNVMQHLFACHSAQHVSVFAYSTTEDDGSEQRNNIRQSTQYRDVGLLSDEAAAQTIVDDGVDVLITLDGWTKNARASILAMQPAPIQVNAIGFSASTGADYLQYALTDRIVSPPQFQHHYSEKWIVMPHVYFGNSIALTHRNVVLEPNKLQQHNITRATIGLPPDAFVFASFGHLYKIDPQTFSCWLRILTAVPNSVLWLMKYPPEAEINLKQFASSFGIPPERLIFSDRFDASLHLHVKQLADLYLDTVTYGAHATALDILWAGVPMITMLGQKMVQRVGATLLHSLQLDMLITSSWSEYEQLAIDLAHDSVRLAAIRQRLQQTRLNAPVFQSEQWVRHWETALRCVYDLYLQSSTNRQHFVGVATKS
eukprot:TRINITY_DN7706_c0_g2_i2.p1 TRINITY_DN7706_c0_g2~~TRINITY_DN7706_c0_g2_i2.p1  ORF type:complete len:620 (+),score=169.46 TRINITY_DN7706_c0_g2_i2:319-2178(+)